MTKHRRLLVTIAMVGVAMLGLGGQAAAAVTAENAWVRGEGNWTWGADRLTNVTLSVTDKACNATSVYVRLRVFKMDGTFVSGTARFNTAGCGIKKTWNGLSWNGSTGGYLIAGVVVHACEDNGVNCVSSAYHDNPKT